MPISMTFCLFPLSDSPVNETDISHQLTQNHCVLEKNGVFLPNWPLSLAKYLASVSYFWCSLFLHVNYLF